MEKECEGVNVYDEREKNRSEKREKKDGKKDG